MITFKFCEIDYPSTHSHFLLSSDDMLRFSDFYFSISFPAQQNSLIETLDTLIDMQIKDNALIYSNGSKLDSILAQRIKQKKPNVQIVTITSWEQCDFSLFYSEISEFPITKLGYLFCRGKSNNGGLIACDAYHRLIQNPNSQIVFLTPFFNLSSENNLIYANMELSKLPYFILELLNPGGEVIPSVLMQIIPSILSSDIDLTKQFFDECCRLIDPTFVHTTEASKIIAPGHYVNKYKIYVRDGNLLSENNLCFNYFIK